jgi:hypothetical protein
MSPTNKQLELEIRALRIWLWHAPDRSMLEGGMAATTDDGGKALFAEIQKIERQLQRQLSKLEATRKGRTP